MTRRPSSRSRKYRVFDFGAEDERVEKDSEKLLRKFASRNASAPSTTKRKEKRLSSSSPVSKYKFLECFAGCIGDVEKASSCEPILVDDGQFDVDKEGEGRGNETFCKKIGDNLLNADAICIGQDCKLVYSTPSVLRGDQAFTEDASHSNIVVLSSSSKFENEPIGVDSDDSDDDDVWLEVNTSATSMSTVVGSEGPPQENVTDYHFVSCEIDQLNKRVTVFPDFILYRNVYCTQSCLIFSKSCIQVEGSTINGAKGTFDAEWTIDDVMCIEWEWCASVNTATVYLHFQSKAPRGSGNAKENSGNDILKFSVYDPLWSKGQEAIKSLNIRYRSIWNKKLCIDVDNSDTAFTAGNNIADSNSCLSFDDKGFEDVIYPEGDADAVTISRQDVELLQPETFINDTIIDFYIKYLKNRIPTDQQQRFLFFNSFFFRKLVDLDKEKSCACKSRAAFLRVRKWTRDFNLFETDYVFIPVNYSFHWSLIVVCHPGEVVCFKDDGIETSAKAPCILHMNSIRGSHRGLTNLVQSYLCEEWKERHSDIVDDVSSKFQDLQYIVLELPQQENSFDCGLFLLHYVERFLEEVPVDFSPSQIPTFSKFLTRNWFPPKEASLKRTHIKKLIYKISKEQRHQVHSEHSVDLHLSSKLCCTNELQADVEFIEERSSLHKAVECCSSAADTVISPSPSSLRVPQEVGERDLLEHRTRARSGAHEWRSMLSPLEEDEGHDEQVSCSLSDKDGCQIAGVVTEFPRTPGSAKYFESSENCRDEKHMHLEQVDDDSSSRTVSSGSLKLSGIGVDDNNQLPKFAGFLDLRGSEVHASSSTSNGDIAACVVEDSEEADSLQADDICSASSFPANRNFYEVIEQLDDTQDVGTEINWPHSSENFVESAERMVKSKKGDEC